uniref:Putative sodium-coupled monocarboxylate transporter 1-like isoform x1 n=1 Tax=Panstrongylus lignarius TaxID=156445 RepID=A0A224XMB8_9HEMI
MQHYMFDWAEYSVFIMMLTLSALIGLYFGCFKTGQNSEFGYLLGGRNMTTLPIAVSLVSSYISAITLLGVPTEIYTYGTQFFLANITNILVGIVTGVIYLPVFYKLQLVSLYEYLELRFNHSVRLIASFMNAVSLITFIPIVIYGPALAFNQVSGVHVHIISPIICLVCIFYTTLGGLKAVVWTDTLQGVLMLMATAAVAFIGLRKVGGIANVIQAAKEGDRIDFFNFDPDPTVRLSFWSMIFGLLFTWTAQLAVNPGVVQRFIALPTYRQAQWSIILMTIGVDIFAILTMSMGLIMYAEYQTCDPLSAKVISRADQILPHFVLDVAGKIKGLPGLFFAGIVSAALSTMSTSLNTLAATIFKDFIVPYMQPKTIEERAGLILKIIVIVTGVVCTLFILVIENLGHILEIASSFGGMTTGASLGIFTLGILFPRANTWGALGGGLVSMALMSWIFIGNQVVTALGLINYTTKPVRIDGCTNFTSFDFHNATSVTSMTATTDGDVFYLYKISVFHYGLISCMLVLIIGIPISLLTGQNHQLPHRDLISPLLYRWLPSQTDTRNSELSLRAIDARDNMESI